MFVFASTKVEVDNHHVRSKNIGIRVSWSKQISHHFVSISRIERKHNEYIFLNYYTFLDQYAQPNLVSTKLLRKNSVQSFLMTLFAWKRTKRATMSNEQGSTSTKVTRRIHTGTMQRRASLVAATILFTTCLTM